MNTCALHFKCPFCSRLIPPQRMFTSITGHFACIGKDGNKYVGLRYKCKCPFWAQVPVDKYGVTMRIGPFYFTPDGFMSAIVFQPPEHTEGEAWKQ